MKCAVTRRSTCRICGGADFEPVVAFPAMPFTDELLRKDRIGEEFLSDITIVWCRNCRTAQNPADVHVADYYRDYQYTVSSSRFARNFMTRLAENASSRFGLHNGDRVIEIGSGDGFQLRCFQDLGARVLGFEPSDSLYETAIQNSIPTVKTLFSCTGIEQIPADMRPAHFVLLTYTFDHLPDPVAFLHLIHDVLDPQRGIALIEVHDFRKIFDRREICLFEHEHSIYLTAVSMQRLLNRCGFELLTTNLVDDSERRGNSLLIAAAPRTNRRHQSTFLPTADDFLLDDAAAIRLFQSQVEAGISRLRDYVHSRTRAGLRIAGYGAGGRGVMTLAMTGLTRQEISFVCDQNSCFHGLYTPRTHIPVYAPSHISRRTVDEILVFSYGYLAEIRESLADFVRDGGVISSMLDFL
jgi:SAM-dependent methyltransferase